MRSAIEGVEAAIREVKLAEADLEISKEKLQRQYEINYLDARKQFVKRKAEHLFPKLSRNTREDEQIDANESSSEAA